MTLDDDVAALLQKLQKERDASLKEIVNKALRQGLIALTQPVEPRARFRTETFDLGECSLPNVDNLSEAIAFAEGEGYK